MYVCISEERFLSVMMKRRLPRMARTRSKKMMRMKSNKPRRKRNLVFGWATSASTHHLKTFANTFDDVEQWYVWCVLKVQEEKRTKGK